VRVVANGSVVASATASLPRSDVGAAHPVAGPNHGFDVTAVVPGGRTEVCVVAVNVGAGTANTTLGCRTVDLPTGNPFGALDAVVSPGPGQVRVGGWVIDPDTVDPVAVHVYANGVFVGAASASGTRNDVAAVFPAYGPGHGFNVAMRVPGGRNQVCVFAINVGGGTTNPLLGCRTVDLPTGNPFGVVDSAVASASAPAAGAGAGQVRVRGWVIDPDTVDPVAVHVYANGVFVGAASASVIRNDVAAAFPAYGPNHGFDVTVPVTAAATGASVQVCVFAINVGGGTTNPLLGCQRS
jgi:phage tail protein X